jgi:hypothetical protein
MKQNYNILDESHAIPLPSSLPRGAKTIRIPCSPESYEQLTTDRDQFKSYLNDLLFQSPELFPISMSNGYSWHDILPPSIKLGIQLYRIKVTATQEVYTICPSYVMPYMTGFTTDVEKVLFLQRFGVPFWALTYVFGKDDMHWYRMSKAFGRASILGTTVKTEEALPKDLLADEKHTFIQGDKIYGAMTVGDGCILGASLCHNVDEEALTKGYETFKKEARNVAPSYQPNSVNVDGWTATTNAWRTLFPKISIILCFLHAFLRIRDVCKKAPFFKELSDLVWNTYDADNKKSFSQRIRRLKEWAIENIDKGIVLDKVLSLCDKSNRFKVSYDHPDGARTSNMIDRLMRWADRYLFAMQYFHGTYKSAQQSFTAWAILRNFQPYCARVKRGKNILLCAASELNGFSYHQNWLENLLISMSMNGYRQT